MDKREFDIAYGVHSGYRLCCVVAFIDGWGGGACKECEKAGREPDTHKCSWDEPACVPYLEYVNARMEKQFPDRLKQFCTDPGGIFGIFSDEPLTPSMLETMEQHDCKEHFCQEQVHVFTRKVDPPRTCEACGETQ